MNENRIVLFADEKAERNNRIWDDIRYCESMRAEYEDALSECSTQIGELECLETGLLKVSEGFESRQQYRRQVVLAISEMPELLNMGMIFAQGMTGLLNGAQYRAVCDGMSSASERVKEKLNELTAQAESYRNEIGSLEDEMWYLYNQLE